jgi:hypothetical protein
VSRRVVRPNYKCCRTTYGTTQKCTAVSRHDKTIRVGTSYRTTTSNGTSYRTKSSYECKIHSYDGRNGHKLSYEYDGSYDEISYDGRNSYDETSLCRTTVHCRVVRHAVRRLIRHKNALSYDKVRRHRTTVRQISYDAIVLRRTIVRQLVAISSYFYVNFTIIR